MYYYVQRIEAGVCLLYSRVTIVRMEMNFLSSVQWKVMSVDSALQDMRQKAASWMQMLNRICSESLTRRNRYSISHSLPLLHSVTFITDISIAIGMTYITGSLCESIAPLQVHYYRYSEALPTIALTLCRN